MQLENYDTLCCETEKLYNKYIKIKRAINEVRVYASSLEFSLIERDEHIEKLEQLVYGTEKKVCSICQEDIEDHQKRTDLDSCSHSYHSNCIFQWLKCRGLGADCPMCKTDILKYNT
jgi:hypothetical protein